MCIVYVQKLDPTLDNLSYAHQGDAGVDLRSADELTLQPGEGTIVKTGIRLAIPEGYAGLIWDRSGLAAKHHLHVFAGVIDSGYRGEVGVVLKNLGSQSFTVERNMRIAQLLIQPVVQADIQTVAELPETTRGEGGFGSTGTH